MRFISGRHIVCRSPQTAAVVVYSSKSEVLRRDVDDLMMAGCLIAKKSSLGSRPTLPSLQVLTIKRQTDN